MPWQVYPAVLGWASQSVNPTLQNHVQRPGMSQQQPASQLIDRQGQNTPLQRSNRWCLLHCTCASQVHALQSCIPLHREADKQQSTTQNC